MAALIVVLATGGLRGRLVGWVIGSLVTGLFAHFRCIIVANDPGFAVEPVGAILIFAAVGAVMAVAVFSAAKAIVLKVAG